MHGINNSMSSIDLIFCTSQSVISSHRVDVSVFDNCHHNIIYGNVNAICAIIKKQILKILRKEYLTLIRIKLLKIFQ